MVRVMFIKNYIDLYEGAFFEFGSEADLVDETSLELMDDSGRIISGVEPGNYVIIDDESEDFELDTDDADFDLYEENFEVPGENDNYFAAGNDDIIEW